MIILDFETNSHNANDVLEVAAHKLVLKDDKYEVVETFHRYYYSKFPVNSFALQVHKLSPEVIMQKRQDASYALFFNEDEDFKDFCEGATTLIAHNATFELKHLEGVFSFRKSICTMKNNRTTVKARNKNGAIKNPKLSECCAFYNIEFDEDLYHSALYDVDKTLEVFNLMPRS